MTIPLAAWRAGKLAIAGFLVATSAFAQSAPSQSTTPWPPRWTVTAGIESFWWRDVARSGPPVDASPMSWEGQGPFVSVAYQRGGRSRLHHFEGSYAAAGGFELRSPIRTAAAPAGDSASRLSGRYEYRRYPWRDLWTTGFDVGIGVEGRGERQTTDQGFEPGIELKRGLNTVGTAVVAAARWQRSPRWSLLAAWANGISVGRSTREYRGDLETTHRGWGGGWYSNLELRGDVRVASRAVATAAWFNNGEGRHGVHDSFTFGRSRFTVGVTYGR